MENKLQVRHLRISFRTTAGKVQAVRDISFNLHKGETMAIVASRFGQVRDVQGHYWAYWQATQSWRVARSSMTARIC